jgi:hypothetical protein
MRLSLLTIIVVFSASMLFAADRYVAPTKDGIGIFKNQIRELYEKPIVSVGTSDRLQIVESKGTFHKVKTGDGTVGWVEKSAVKNVSAASGGNSANRSFVFDNAEVIGYLDNPTPVYIMDTDDPNADPINLDRSFKDALRENVDKETVERQVK